MSARFPLLVSPPVAPACCVSCGRGSDPVGFFDLGQFVELYGAIYLCATCLREMAAALGLVAPDTAALERERTARLSAERALATSLASEERLRSTLGEQMLRLLHEVTLERLRLELAAERGTDGADLDAPDGGGTGGGAGAGGQLADAAGGGPADPDHGAPAGPGVGRARGRPRKAAEPGAGPQPAGGGGAAGDGAGAAPAS